MLIAPWIEVGGKKLPAFADIFLTNCTKNGMLAIELSEAQVDEIFEQTAAHTGLQATVDLAEQRVTILGATQSLYHFEIEAGAKEQLFEGLDDIALSLQYEGDIATFEARHPVWLF